MKELLIIVLVAAVLFWVGLCFYGKLADAQDWYIPGHATSYVPVQLPYSPGFQLPYSVYATHLQTFPSLGIVKLPFGQGLHHLSQPGFGAALNTVYWNSFSPYSVIYNSSYFLPVPVQFGIGPPPP